MFSSSDFECQRSVSDMLPWRVELDTHTCSKSPHHPLVKYHVQLCIRCQIVSNTFELPAS